MIVAGPLQLSWLRFTITKTAWDAREDGVNPSLPRNCKRNLFNKKVLIGQATGKKFSWEGNQICSLAGSGSQVRRPVPRDCC